MAKRGKRKKWPFILGGAFLTCGVSGVIVGFFTGIGPYDLPSRSRQLDGIIAESKRLGLPLTAEELTGPKPPDETNAAPQILALLETIEGAPIEAAMARPGDDDELFEKQAAWITAHERQLDEIAKIVAERDVWFVERDWDFGIYLEFSEFAKTKHVVKLFVARSVSRALDGDVDGAISDLVASRRLSALTEQDPTLIGLLVAIATEAISLASVETLVDVWRGNARALNLLEVAVSDFNEKPVANHLRCEFFASVTTARNLKRLGGIKAIVALSSGREVPKIDTSKVQRDGLPQDMLGRASLASTAEIMNDVFLALEKAKTEEIDWAGVVERRLLAMEDRNRVSDIFAQIMLPVYSGVQSALQNDRINQQLALAFVKAIRFQAEKGRWPHDLDEIDCNYDDPFNPGNSVQAHFGDTDVRIWSIGRDRRDSGGKIGAEESGSRDTVYRWPPQWQIKRKIEGAD